MVHCVNRTADRKIGTELHAGRSFHQPVHAARHEQTKVSSLKLQLRSALLCPSTSSEEFVYDVLRTLGVRTHYIARTSHVIFLKEEVALGLIALLVAHGALTA